MTGSAMAAVARMVMERTVAGTFSRNSTNYNFTLTQSSETNTTSSATGILIEKLVFAESKSVRTSTIILASFNTLAALATASSIVYDCWVASRRCNPKFKESKFCLRRIHPAETFPLILAIGIFIQGIVFAVVQAQGLSALFVEGCSVTAQFMWPALFIVPYIQVVFGVECAFRSLRSQPFKARRKHDVTIYCVLIAVMLIATWIPSNLFKEPDTCFASLMWFLTRYGTLGLVLLSISVGLMLLSALIIFIKLSTVDLIDEHQRIAASRMVYYLALGALSLAFVLPWFVSLVDTKTGDLKDAMMATVVVNLSGLITGLLQLFLRSNTATTSFGPSGSRDRKKHDIRIWGPNELVFNSHLMEPIDGPPSPPRELASRADSQAELMGFEKETEGGISMDSLRSPPFELPARYKNTAATTPTEAKVSTNIETRSHARKPSYSLFPPEEGNPTNLPTANSRQQDPTSVYDISDLIPPPNVFGVGRVGHKRDSSVASSATVQIGLRISHALPNMTDTSALPLPATTYNAKAARPPPPSPLQKQSFAPLSPTLKSPFRPSPLKISNTKATSPVKPILSPEALSAINKTLPPTPRPSPPVSRESNTNTKLSPTVYSPGKKTVQTPRSPPARRPRESSLGTPSSPPVGPSQPATTEGKSDWI